MIDSAATKAAAEPGITYIGSYVMQLALVCGKNIAGAHGNGSAVLGGGDNYGDAAVTIHAVTDFEFTIDNFGAHGDVAVEIIEPDGHTGIYLFVGLAVNNDLTGSGIGTGLYVGDAVLAIFLLTGGGDFFMAADDDAANFADNTFGVADFGFGGLHFSNLNALVAESSELNSLLPGALSASPLLITGLGAGRFNLLLDDIEALVLGIGRDGLFQLLTTLTGQSLLAVLLQVGSTISYSAVSGSKSLRSQICPSLSMTSGVKSGLMERHRVQYMVPV